MCRGNHRELQRVLVRLEEACRKVYRNTHPGVTPSVAEAAPLTVTPDVAHMMKRINTCILYLETPYFAHLFGKGPRR